MFAKKIKLLERLKRQVGKLEAAIEHERGLELAGLPQQFGFKSAAEFIKAVKGAGNTRRRKTRKRKLVRRKRATITDKIRARVVAAVKRGKTGSSIAKKFGISLPSVQNIRKAAGLVKKAASKQKFTPAK